ncbi:MAG: class I SAM-dependent methyltransferase [Deltaproteobacteria bacterium]|nr:class I SAM-dependent methyltransferase [Deltaproteobacteria bacterium]
MTHSAKDAYIAYTHRYFRAWLPVYDLFGLLIVAVYQRAAKVIAAHPGLSVLDVCTGTGEMALRCASAGAEVTGVDVTREMLQQAKSKARRRRMDINFSLMDARQLAFANNRFDVTVLALALHDMPRKVRLQVVQEAARVARDRLVILDYDLPRNHRLRRLALAFLMTFETPYLRDFSKEGVLPILRSAGLHTLRVRHCPWSFFTIYEVDLSNGSPSVPQGGAGTGD